jgi:ribosomal protein L11 methyltransferase
MRHKKSWIKAEYWATKATLEVAQSALLECGAIGIEIDDGLGPEGARKYADDQILIKAYFEPSDDIEKQVTEALARFFGECGFVVGPIQFARFDEEDWQGNFVKTCTTFVVKPDIYIVPSFEIDQFLPTSKGKLYIEMDPENAFGTGQHQTTKLCLTNIHELMAKTPVLNGLDVGTGSGILAILMKKLHAQVVKATEVDEDALITAEKNAVKNGVDIITLQVDEHHIYEQNTFDLVVANILAPVLIDMADNLCGCLKQGGYIILSGILAEQANAVINEFTNRNLKLIKHDLMDDWCALVFLK